MIKGLQRIFLHHPQQGILDKKEVSTAATMLENFEKQSLKYLVNI
jgi:hypothetical protein